MLSKPVCRVSSEQTLQLTALTCHTNTDSPPINIDISYLSVLQNLKPSELDKILHIFNGAVFCSPELLNVFTNEKKIFKIPHLSVYLNFSEIAQIIVTTFAVVLHQYICDSSW